jgi:glutamate racemase
MLTGNTEGFSIYLYGGQVRIGVFDSGIGGLTVFSALHNALPSHDLIYLGDTARVPYGTRSAETVTRYSCRVASYLWQLQVEAIVIACNTATTYALETLQKTAAPLGIQVFGVIEPGVEAALKQPHTASIAVIGTPGTISGGAYQAHLARVAPEVTVTATACPLFVPLAEEGWTTGEVPKLVAARYLTPLQGKVDTVILGCTHYPLLRDAIQQCLPDATLVDSASATAALLHKVLHDAPSGTGERQFFVTDHIERFTRVGASFLGWSPEPVSWVDLGPAQGPFATACKPERR